MDIIATGNEWFETIRISFGGKRPNVLIDEVGS